MNFRNQNLIRLKKNETLQIDNLCKIKFKNYKILTFTIHGTDRWTRFRDVHSKTCPPDTIFHQNRKISDRWKLN